MKIRKLIRHAISAVLLFFVTTSLAESPVTLLQGIADKMVAQLSANQSKLKTDPDIIRKIVENVLIPYVDTTRMAGSVVGRTNWYSVSGDERRQFVEAFQQVVFQAASESGRFVRILHRLSQPADHPVNIYHPEGSYLKGLVLEVE